MFKSVSYDQNLGSTIARVNRLTGDLIINPRIWERLSTDERDFVMLHEEGHLKLQTRSEFEANNYAIGKFMPVGELSDTDLMRKITVLAEIQKRKKHKQSDTEAAAITEASGQLTNGIFDTIGVIFSALPGLGIGTKSRQEELKLQLKNRESDNSRVITSVIIAAVALILIVVLFVIFKK